MPGYNDAEAAAFSDINPLRHCAHCGTDVTRKGTGIPLPIQNNGGGDPRYHGCARIPDPDGRMLCWHCFDDFKG
jgi:hypothetical protein